MIHTNKNHGAQESHRRKINVIQKLKREFEEKQMWEEKCIITQH